jgi:uncharacterized protein (DUF433 family)
MSAKYRAINRSLTRSELEALAKSELEAYVAKNGQLDHIQRNRIRRWKLLDYRTKGLAPADIKEIWAYANEKLKHLDPKYTINGTLEGEHDLSTQFLFEARRGIYLAQLEIFKLMDNPLNDYALILSVQSEVARHYNTIKARMLLDVT